MTIVVDLFDNYFNCGYFITSSFLVRSDGLVCGSESAEFAYSADALGFMPHACKIRSNVSTVAGQPRTAALEDLADAIQEPVLFSLKG
jgi:hypothetical protein